VLTVLSVFSIGIDNLNVRGLVIFFGVCYLLAAVGSMFSGSVIVRGVSVAFGMSLLVLMAWTLSYKVGRQFFAILIIFFILLSVGVANFSSSGGRSVFTVFVALAAFGMAWAAIYHNATMLFFEVPFYLFLGLTVWFVFLGYGPDEFNMVFEGYSRNGYSAVLMLFAIGYIFSRCYRSLNVSIVLMAAVVVCSIPLYGRTGIAMASVLFLVALWSRHKIIAANLSVLVLLVPVFLASDIGAYISAHTNFSSGVDSPRFVMWVGYLERMDLLGFLFGVDLNSVPMIADYNGNPHNAFFLLHAYYGVGFFALFLCFLGSFFFLLMDSRWVFVALLLIFLVRSFFDIIYLFGLLDYLVFPILFYSVFRRLLNEEETGARAD